ncbi:MAG: glycogen synthase GlgA [Limisphaerales bacterium]|jgi:starch synthase
MMRILIAVSELHPFSKTGGLADMVAAMAKTLAKRSYNITILTPLYKGIQERFQHLNFSNPKKTNIQLGTSIIEAEFLEINPKNNLKIVFVKQPHFYFRDSLYVDKNGFDYPDNSARFIFFSKSVVEFARNAEISPDIIHVHDWQTALIPLFIKHLKDFWKNTPKAVLTIHNLAFQGIFPKDHYQLTNLPWDYFNPEGAEFYGNLNCLKAGIVYSDKIITVSPRYAREIMLPEFGCGLDGVLRWKNHSLAGILNGVDYEEWNTENNPYIYAPYSVNNMSGKNVCKKMLQREFKLKESKSIPLFATISRLTSQKGMDILLDALKVALHTYDMHFILLGRGEHHFEAGFEKLYQDFPTKVRIIIGFDQILAHKIESGADFFIMPSRFEPCGLNQMYSLRYGTIPIVRRTGGLDDSVIDITDNQELANGIKFTEYSTSALLKAIQKAFVIFKNKALLKFYRTNAMKADFSWEKAATEYEKIYGSLANGKD